LVFFEESILGFISPIVDKIDGTSWVGGLTVGVLGGGILFLLLLFLVLYFVIFEILLICDKFDRFDL
jgi:di/tricarboxylate transporter